MSTWLQISSGRGPAECGFAVGRVADLLLQESEKHKCQIHLLDKKEEATVGCFSSITLLVEEEDLPDWLNSWIGTIQWTCASPFRPNHKRKNWFVSVQPFEASEIIELDQAKVRYETFRASGPGGQHVNKTETAVRVIYTPTGATATSQDGRSQSQNKKIALERLKKQISDLNESGSKAVQQQKWQQHDELERGNPVRIYEGEQFKLKR